uniref:Uncharacterized protein n=1 Tax=Arundo donax TaxID=35708 RepID=A0A0A9FNM6_ARUDO
MMIMRTTVNTTATRFLFFLRFLLISSSLVFDYGVAISGKSTQRRG